MRKILSALTALSVAALLPFAASAATLSTPLNVGTLFPNNGAATAVSGNCGTSGANSTVAFSLMQNNTTTALPTSTNLNTDASGAFSGSLAFPSGQPAGSATLVARCTATGDIINSSTITFPAAASSGFTFGSVPPAAGGVVNLSGACGGSGGSGTVQLNLVNSGTTTSLGSFNLGSTGTFQQNVLIPGTGTVGAGTVTAVCSNGTTFSSPITVRSAAIDNFQLSPGAVLGANASVSGMCSAGGINPNRQVDFSLVRDGISTRLSSTNTTTDFSGRFNSTIGYPAGYGGGPATLVVSCPDGSTFSTLVFLNDPTTPAGLQFPSGLVMGDTTDTTAMGGDNETGAVLGASVTPVGGVDAGTSPASKTLGLVALAALAIAAAGFTAFRSIRTT